MTLSHLRQTSLLFPLLALAACGPAETTKKTIVSVEVNNGGQTVKVGGTTKVTLTATLADGKKEDISLLANWRTRLTDGTENSAAAFATVDGDGLVRGVAVGSYFVDARLAWGDSFGGYEPFAGNYSIGFNTAP